MSEENWRDKYKDVTPQPIPPNVRDRRGEKYGDLFPYAYLGSRVFDSGQAHAVWRCRCVCGRSILMYSGLFTPKKHLNCGCIRDQTRAPRSRDLQGKKILDLEVVANGTADFVTLRCQRGHVMEVPRRKIRDWQYQVRTGREGRICRECE